MFLNQNGLCTRGAGVLHQGPFLKLTISVSVHGNVFVQVHPVSMQQRRDVADSICLSICLFVPLPGTETDGESVNKRQIQM